MIRQIKKILYTTDLSKSSVDVFEQAVILAAQTGASITILHVIEDGSGSTQNRTVHLINKDEYEKIRQESSKAVKNVLISEQRSIPVIQHALQNLCEKTNEKICRFDTPVVVDAIEVHHGNAADVITQVANAAQCDLIVMGYYKKGSILKGLMGGARKSVMKQSKWPIFLVPLKSYD